MPCTRCGDDRITMSLTVHRGARVAHLDLCVWCAPAFDELLQIPALTPGGPLLDDADHHASCRCPECDADVRLEIVRDRQLDQLANRRSA